MKTINNNLVTVLFTFKLGISLVKKTESIKYFV